MRHRNTVLKLNRAKPERVSMVRNLLKSIIKHETINTTESRYKSLRSHFDRLVTVAKAGDNTATRRVFNILRDKELSMKMINDIAKRYETRNSGYLRAYKLENRQGDNAKMVKIELVK
ncbi:MAG: 50S ribosomal protein L17 [bacterium]